MTQADLVARYSAPVPRYTSYPTAPHFHPGVDADIYGAWLDTIRPDDRISLYLHIPFCDRLCWFCGCHTKQVRRYEPVAAYLKALTAETATLAGRLGGRGRLSAVHFGGGSPTLLQPGDIDRLGEVLRRRFALASDCEISLEIDPNDVDDLRLAAWARFGVTRASFGVQDFDARVQAAINRPQSFEQTRDAIDGFRARGVRSVNLDVLYGLPHQTVETLLRTLDQCLTLDPDRMALFGYAHVPWMKKHQNMIDASVLPDAPARFAQAEAGAERLAAAGMVPIGIDHFARPGDSLAEAFAAGRLRRNFQGYTTDTADVLLGLGASSVGRLPQGHVQNVTATAEYQRRALAGELPIARGVALEPRDRVAAHVIEKLMCEFGFAVSPLSRSFGSDADEIVAIAREASRSDVDGLIRFDGEHFIVSPKGRPFVRTVAAKFDRFLAKGAARHSAPV